MAGGVLYTKSVWKQENDKILLVQKRYEQGGTNDLLDVEIVVSGVIQIEP